MTSCLHTNFRANVAVSRLTKTEGGPVTGFTADVRIHCEECGMPFVFRGMAMGSSFDRPMVSADGEEARLPIQPGDLALVESAFTTGRA